MRRGLFGLSLQPSLQPLLFLALGRLLDARPHQGFPPQTDGVIRVWLVARVQSLPGAEM